MCESIITVFFLKEEAEVREDLLSSPRGTRVDSRHYLLNRPVRECLVTSTHSAKSIHNCVPGLQGGSCGLAYVTGKFVTLVNQEQLLQ